MSAFFPKNIPLSEIDEEQLPVPRHRRHGAVHFFGLYGAEHIAATEFVLGATFVALGASLSDVLIGLVIGNTLAVLSFWLITASIATDVRISLFVYLSRIGGRYMSHLYNGANVIVFAVISAAMITVSATAVTNQLQLPPQTGLYPDNIWFVLTVVCVAAVVIMVAVYGFSRLTEFASVCAPWLCVMFLTGGMVLVPALSASVTGYTSVGLSDFMALAGATVFTGTAENGEPGIGIFEVIGFAWAANTFAHFGLIDMALLRYAKKRWYGLGSSAGMMYGHYVAWLSAGLMGAAVAALTQTSIAQLEPGRVAFYALAWSGFVVVIVAGWTTANANLYRAGLAAQALFPQYRRDKVTLSVGVLVVVAACFPFVYQNMLPLLTYSGLLLVPVGGIVFAEHYVFRMVGQTRFWCRFKGLKDNWPAVITWALSLAFAALLQLIDVIPYFYLFLPTWVFAILCYTLLARSFGANGDFSEQLAEEARFQAKVEAFQEAEADRHGTVTIPPDRSLLTFVIRAIWIVIGLLVPVGLAVNTLLFSPNMYFYLANSDQFYEVTIWCTGIYFIFAFWGMKRAKNHRQTAMQQQQASRESAHLHGSQPA